MHTYIYKSIIHVYIYIFTRTHTRTHTHTLIIHVYLLIFTHNVSIFHFICNYGNYLGPTLKLFHRVIYVQWYT